MILKANQAQALYESVAVGGGLHPQCVGSGKTLICALLPTVFKAQRPLIVVPAHLKSKTEREFRELHEHWDVWLDRIRIETYQTIASVTKKNLLPAYGPDLIVGDEIHYLKDPQAGRTKRFRHYLDENPRCKFVGLSGTITRTSILEFAHLLLWALGKINAPLPMSTLRELQDWASVLDARETDTDPGGLYHFGHDIESIRQGYQKRLTETWGVVATHDKPEDLGVSLTIQHVRHEPPDEIKAHLAKLRLDWETPDGWALFDGKDVARHARELALGFFYRWNPRPPKEWLLARKAWSKECRHILRTNQRQIATQKDVILNLEHYPEAAEVYAAWKAIEPTFTPNTDPVWVSDYAVRLAALWMTENDGIVWTEHKAFAKALEAHAGAPYYGGGGVNSAGQAIEAHKPSDGPCIASIKANGTGRNLQAWNRGLTVSPYMNAAQWEQKLARMHRFGQKADEVINDILMLIPEHDDAWREALAMARYEEQITGQKQKLLYANITEL